MTCPVPECMLPAGSRTATIMVREKPDQLLKDMRARFPKADLVRDENACAANPSSCSSRQRTGWPVT